MEISISEKTRPSTLEQIVGCDYIKQTIKYSVTGAAKLNETPPHFLLSGSAGTGKTTVARAIGECNGGEFHQIMGYDLKSSEDIQGLAASVKSKDCILIDEAQAMNAKAQVALLSWLEDYRISTENGRVDAPRVSFCFATTNPGKLSRPLRERCKNLQLSFYSLNQLKQILYNAGLKYNLNLRSDDDALTLLAQCSRGIPRIAILHRLDLLRKMMIVDNLPYNLTTVENMLKINKINEFGLEANDMKYLEVLYDKLTDNSNKPVSKKIISQCVGLDDDGIDVLESYLNMISAIRILSNGRTLTPFGCELINKPIITSFNAKKASAVRVDIEKMKKFLEDKGNHKKGMKGLADFLGLTYGKDNHLLREALKTLGYQPVQRAGIISI